MNISLEDLRQEISSRQIVTIGKAQAASGLSREELVQYVKTQNLKIYDEEKGHWYNEDAKGHC